GLDLYRERSNVAVLRTFSKAYGLAGLRVGFCVAHEPVAEALRKVQTPFGVSSVAQAAAVAALAAEDEALDRVHLLVGERERVQASLKAAGFAPAESESNFIWLRLLDLTSDFAQACESVGLAVRPFTGEGVRVSVGLPEANDRFIETATQWRRTRP
ncbi:MAG: aminotransferase class I/II-fold pyridoxal phosphate-dependent enzyme, partial [Actinomycetota bacterium]|nr:aminotransferase class I/II-fold pyridoxal phosphate-dependent enzyme [Actinomycetota bacterium]